MSAPETGANAPDLPLKPTDDLADEIALLAAHIQAATCRLLVLIAEMDRREGYANLGFKSCAHWLSWRTGDCLPTAREKVRVARKLVQHPLVRETFAEGRISYSPLAEDVIGKVQAAGDLAAFFLRPTRVDQVWKIAMSGQRMPQKSTNFYPKLITGLVLNDF